MSERMYEEERLLLHVQEALAEAIERSGMPQKDIAVAAGVKPQWVSFSLASPGMTLKTAARIAHAAGYRIVVALEKLESE